MPIAVPEFSNFAVVITASPMLVLAMVLVRKKREGNMVKNQEKLLEMDKLKRK